MTNFAQDTSDFLVTLLIECLNSKLYASDPSISPKELEDLLVPPDTAVENLPGILDELSKRSDVLPPLHCDAFGIPQDSTCTQLIQKIRGLHEDALRIAVNFFKEMETYTHYLNVNPDNLTKADRVTYESQLEIMREQINLVTSLHRQIFR